MQSQNPLKSNPRIKTLKKRPNSLLTTVKKTLLVRENFLLMMRLEKPKKSLVISLLTMMITLSVLMMKTRLLLKPVKAASFHLMKRLHSVTTHQPNGEMTHQREGTPSTSKSLNSIPRQILLQRLMTQPGGMKVACNSARSILPETVAKKLQQRRLRMISLVQPWRPNRNPNHLLRRSSRHHQPVIMMM